MPQEQALQLGHRRPFDAEREIAPDLGRRGDGGIRRVDLRLRVGRFASRDLALVVGGKVDAADNADFSVDDHDFPVVAIVGRVASRRGLQGIGRVELQHVDAGSPQAVEKLDGRVA